MLVVFTPAAEMDIALDWYEHQVPRVGPRFIAELKATADRLAANPLQFPTVHNGCRRALLRRFPYALFFRVRDNNVDVLACFHMSRDPRLWQARA